MAFTIAEYLSHGVLVKVNITSGDILSLVVLEIACVMILESSFSLQ